MGTWPRSFKNRNDLWSCRLTFQGHECENRQYLLDRVRQAFRYYETLLGSRYRTFRIRKKWPWMTFKVKIASGVTSVRDRSMLAIGHLISFDNLIGPPRRLIWRRESVISATVGRLVVTYHRTVHVTLNLIDFFRSISVNIIFKSVFQLFQTNTAQYVCPWACIIQWCTSKHDRNQYVDEILRHQRYIIRK